MFLIVCQKITICQNSEWNQYTMFPVMCQNFKREILNSEIISKPEQWAKVVCHVVNNVPEFEKFWITNNKHQVSLDGEACTTTKRAATKRKATKRTTTKRARGESSGRWSTCGELCQRRGVGGGGGESHASNWARIRWFERVAECILHHLHHPLKWPIIKCMLKNLYQSKQGIKFTYFQ